MAAGACSTAVAGRKRPCRREPVAPARTARTSRRSSTQAQSPGLIGYRGKVPVGWISIAPREEFAKLKRSQVMKPVDENPVWSVICFVIPSEFRGQGISHLLLKGAIAYAKKRGARLIEAYPVDKPGRSSDDGMWFGAKSLYDRAGFKEVARRKPTRPVVRLNLA